MPKVFAAWMFSTLVVHQKLVWIFLSIHKSYPDLLNHNLQRGDLYTNTLEFHRWVWCVAQLDNYSCRPILLRMREKIKTNIIISSVLNYIETRPCFLISMLNKSIKEKYLLLEDKSVKQLKMLTYQGWQFNHQNWLQDPCLTVLTRPKLLCYKIY